MKEYLKQTEMDIKGVVKVIELVKIVDKHTQMKWTKELESKYEQILTTFGN